MRRAVAIALILLVAGCTGGGGGSGAPVATPTPTPALRQGFTRQSDFLVAIGGYADPRTVGFDGVPGGTPLPSGGTSAGITLTYVIPGFTAVATSSLPTTSPANALGLDAPDGETFTGGDGFTMTFDRTVHAVGLLVIGEDLGPGDVTLSSGSGASVTTGGVDPDLAVSGARVFFLGLTDPAGFTTATVSSAAEGYVFNVDDVRTAVTPP